MASHQRAPEGYIYIYKCIYKHLILYTSCISIVSYICGKIGSGRSELIWVPRILLHLDHDTKRNPSSVIFSWTLIGYYYIILNITIYYLWLGETFSASQAMKVEALAWWRRSAPTNFRTAPCRCFSFQREFRHMTVWTVCLVLFSNMIDYSLAHCYLINVRREVWTQCLGCSSDLPLLFLIPQCPILHWVSCLEERPFFD